MSVSRNVTLDADHDSRHFSLMLNHRRMKSAALKRLAKSGDGSKIDAEWRRKVERLLGQLNVAVHPAELDLPGNHFHELKGDRVGTYSVTVRRNFRITFRWDSEGPFDVDLEDYHGH